MFPRTPGDLRCELRQPVRGNLAGLGGLAVLDEVLDSVDGVRGEILLPALGTDLGIAIKIVAGDRLLEVAGECDSSRKRADSPSLLLLSPGVPLDTWLWV